MSLLVIAEQDNHSLKPATLNTLAAAKAIGGDIQLLVAGKGCRGVAEAAAQLDCVTQVIYADSPAYEHFLAENLADLVVALSEGRTHILAPATTFGKDFMPRVAALLNVNQLSDIIRVEAPDTFARPIYAGNAIATVKTQDSIKVLTVRATAFDPVASSEGASESSSGSGGAEIISVESLVSSDTLTGKGLSQFVKDELAECDRPELTAAGVVISGGRGLQSAENFDMLYRLADKLGAAVGASRAAVDAGFVPNDMQVGQTGKVVAPELYIAVGISGAIQHLAGMKDSKVIVAINKDEEAPIFQVADYGLVADLFEVIPELEKAF